MQVTDTSTTTAIPANRIGTLALESAWGEYYFEPYPGMDDAAEVTLYCGRCGGKGYIAAYGHIDGGICYECGNGNGQRSWTATVAQERFKARRRAQSALRRERKREARDKAQRLWREKHAEVLAGLEAIPFSTFAASLLEQAETRPLTEKQLAAAEKAIAKSVEKQAAKEAAVASLQPLPEGRFEYTGIIASVKVVENIYSYHGGSTVKMLVETDLGYRLYGTMPSELVRQLWGTTEDGVGQRVKFTASAKLSDRDPLFGYFSRPGNAEVLESDETPETE